MTADLYGWTPPVRLSTRRLLVLLVLFVLVWAHTALAILILVNGLPGGHPVLPHDKSRILLFGLSAILLILIWRPAWRPVALPLALISGILGSAPIYSPHQLVVEVAAMLNGRAASDALILSCLAGLALAIWLTYGMMAGLRARKSLSKGSTRWGSGKALLKPVKGFWLGKLGRDYLRYDRDGHLMTIAATRSGKGVGTVIPNLLQHPGGALVTDPKGENFAASATFRSQVLGQTIIPLDPFELAEASKDQQVRAVNPLDLIDMKKDDYVEPAMMLADMIVGPGSDARDSHWQLEAKALLFTYILYVAASSDPEERNLIRVRELLTEDPKDMTITWERMSKSKISQVREGAGRIKQKPDRERSAVYSTAHSRTHFLTSPRMQKVLKHTNVPLAQLSQGLLSLYLILPREYLTVYASWLRLMIACAYTVTTRQFATLAKHKATDNRVLFLLDEFANLGHMSIIKEAVSLGAGYGITLWLILQDLAQLRRTYKDDWESFLANCDVIQAFAIQDPFTSQKIAGMLGDMTIWERRLSKASRHEGSHLKSGYAEASRPLIKPDELRRLHPDRQVLLVRPYQPVIADKLIYYRDSVLAPRAHMCPDPERTCPNRDNKCATTQKDTV